MGGAIPAGTGQTSRTRNQDPQRASRPYQEASNAALAIQARPPSPRWSASVGCSPRRNPADRKRSAPSLAPFAQVTNDFGYTSRLCSRSIRGLPGIAVTLCWVKEGRNISPSGHLCDLHPDNTWPRAWPPAVRRRPWRARGRGWHLPTPAAVLRHKNRTPCPHARSKAGPSDPNEGSARRALGEYVRLTQGLEPSLLRLKHCRIGRK